jgi:hypothetical protein
MTNLELDKHVMRLYARICADYQGPPDRNPTYESRGAGTRQRLNLPETVTGTDMFNLKE